MVICQVNHGVPCGKRASITNWKDPHHAMKMGKKNQEISMVMMVIFHSYVTLPEGKSWYMLNDDDSCLIIVMNMFF